MTPLHVAYWDDVVKLLLEHEANIEAKDMVWFFELFIQKGLIEVTNTHYSLNCSGPFDSPSFCLSKRSSRSCKNVVGTQSKH